MTDTTLAEPTTVFRIPEKSPTADPPRHPYRPLEERLRAMRAELTSLNGNLYKARWRAVALIVETIHAKLSVTVSLNLGTGGVRPNPEELVDYVFNGDHGTSFSQLVSTIRYIFRENIPASEVYEWIRRNHGLERVYRDVVAKKQINPRGRAVGSGPADITSQDITKRANQPNLHSEDPPRATDASGDEDDDEEIVIEDAGPEPEPLPLDLLNEVQIPADVTRLLAMLRMAFDPGATPQERENARQMIQNRDPRLSGLDIKPDLLRVQRTLELMNELRDRCNQHFEKSFDLHNKLNDANEKLVKAKRTIARLRIEIGRLSTGRRDRAAGRRPAASAKPAA
jgi:hypothetical protein